MSVKREKKIYRTFIISTSLVIALVLSGVFVDMLIRTNRLIQEENIMRGRALFKSIVLTRKWNARYGGVYVEKKRDVKSNPYLGHPEVRTEDGRIFTLRNPALMTREISELAEREDGFTFHMTSLKPINPDNKPDAFEEQALRRFEGDGIPEAYETMLVNGRHFFRYMAPLRVSNECLACHRKQNYSIGDVRGGISVLFDTEALQNHLRVNTTVIIVFGVLTTVFLLALLYWFTAQLIRKLAEARKRIETIAITDELTGLFNRRHVLNRFTEEYEQARRLKGHLSCIIADIDHFKSINDLYGHLAGDEVLKGIAASFRELIRAYDIVGRYGGEEFLFILPDTSIEQAWHLAERIRMYVKEQAVAGRLITISLGATCRVDGDESIDEMIKRADDAMYSAKNAGRDRVEWFPKQ